MFFLKNTFITVDSHPSKTTFENKIYGVLLSAQELKKNSSENHNNESTTTNQVDLF